MFLGRNANVSTIAPPLECVPQATMECRVVYEADSQTTFEAVWKNPDGSDLTLGRDQLYSLLDSISPCPGAESRRQVIDNLQGVHELRETDRGRKILDHHRQAFGYNWQMMAMSRRLLQTVLEGGIVDLGYDQSLFLRDGYVRPLEEVVVDTPFIASRALSSAQAYRRSQGVSYEATDQGAIDEAPLFERIGLQLLEAVVANEEYTSYSYWRFDDMSIFEDVKKLAPNTDVGQLFNRIVSEEDPAEVREAVISHILTEFEPFYSDSGEIYVVPRTFDSEEGISAQAHYHQRRPVAGYSVYRDTTKLCMQYPRLDEPHELTIDGTANENLRFGTYRDRYYDEPDLKPSVVRPVLRWRDGEAVMDITNGFRELVANDQLPPDYTTDHKGWLTYGDTLTGALLLALARQDVAASWKETSQFKTGNEIVIGAAQVPLLGLMSAAKLLDSPFISMLQQGARQVLRAA